MPHAVPDLTTPILYPIGWLLLVIWFGFIGVLVRRVIRRKKAEAARRQARSQAFRQRDSLAGYEGS